MSSREGSSDHDETPVIKHNLRMIMTGREIGLIIGKGGQAIKSIREESGANIFISDDSYSPERIVTVRGTTDEIFEAYTLLCKQIEEESGKRNLRDRDGERAKEKDGLSLRLVVPATQCGPLIGHKGEKIKEIRGVTGANVVVEFDFLPGSTEREVKVSGTRDSVTQTIYHICCVMVESPDKGETIKYEPGGSGSGRSDGCFKCGESGHFARECHQQGEGDGGTKGGDRRGGYQSGGFGDFRGDDRMDRRDAYVKGEITENINISNEQIGLVIGKGGSTIAEIRQMSGAWISINKGRDADANFATEREIRVTGNPDSVDHAKSLIHMAMGGQMDSFNGGGGGYGGHNQRGNDRWGNNARDDFRGNHRGQGRGGGGDGGMNNVLNRPDVQAALTIIGQLGGAGGLAEQLGNMGAGGIADQLQGSMGYNQSGMGGMSRGRQDNYGGNSRQRDDRSYNSRRNKYNPY